MPWLTRWAIAFDFVRPSALAIRTTSFKIAGGIVIDNFGLTRFFALIFPPFNSVYCPTWYDTMQSFFFFCLAGVLHLRTLDEIGV